MSPKSVLFSTFLLSSLISAAFPLAFQLALAAPQPAPASSSSSNFTTFSAALLALKASITSDPTGLFDSWNASSHFCEWEGVLCSNDSQQVKGLLLNSKQLSGTLSPQITELQGLANVSVFNNSFYGPVPMQLDALADTLMQLDLSWNRFTGSIPNSLARCTLLQHLDLNRNALKGQFPSYITNFTVLEYLDLSSNPISGELPPDMGRLSSSLQFFQVSNTSLGGTMPPSLMNCSKLVWLDLADNFLTGPLPSDWTKLASTLQQLKLFDNILSGIIPPSLMNCTKLSMLNLMNNTLEGEIPTSIGKLTLLNQLKLYLNRLSGPVPSSVMNCTLLVLLELSNNNLSGIVPPDIGRLTLVQWVTFSNNPLIKGIIPTSIGACAELQVLKLQNTSLGGPLPSSLFNLTNLQQLNIQSCAFSGSLSASVRQLTSLQLLALNSNGFDGSIPAELGELRSLQGLFLQENKFSGYIPPELSGCISVTEVNLSNNPLMGPIPSSFAQLKGMSKLSIRQTQVSGPIPDIFGSLTRLRILDLAHNALTGPIPSSLAKLDTINELLDLSCNKLTGSIPPSVGDMQMLETMRLQGNAFSGNIPASFGNCEGMQVLDLSMNRLQGEIPTSLGQMKSLQNLDLSKNELSGALPSSLGSLDDLVYLNVSYNALEGQIPSLGIYENSSSFFFFGNPGLCGYPSSTSCDSNPLPQSNSHLKRVAVLVTAVVVGSAVFSAVVGVCLWWWCRVEKDVENIEAEDHHSEEFDMTMRHIKAWKAEELRAVTNNFDAANMLGSGAVSVCYKAVMDASIQGGVVAIKRLKVGDSHGKEARRSFVNELKTICKVRHRNLVKVLGYCVEGGEVALVMEYMEKGDLDQQLHGTAGVLEWDERLNVAADVADGLVYLHHEYVQPIIHCDLKPKNILLGSDMVAKISDFGIARLLDPNQRGDMTISTFRGTFGYAAPENVSGLRISTRMDVYSYGVLLLELVTGLRPTNPALQEEGVSLHTWARKLQEARRTREALDPNLKVDILQEAEKILTLGINCTVEVAKERPDMKEVRDVVLALRRQRFVNQRSFPNIEELLQFPDQALSFQDVNRLLLNLNIHMDCSNLPSSSSRTTLSY